MQKLSGLVLDIHDDAEGAVLRTIFPTFEGMPELVKQASFLRPEDVASLPDEAFALVLIDGDTRLRKFACVDPGHTALSVEYFLKTGHKVPVEAQKVAAQNLKTACGWYDIEVPEKLEKVAIGLMTLISAPSVIKNTSQQMGKNLNAIKGSGSIINPQALNLK